jgi:predicted permease
MFDTIWRDLRHGARVLTKNPGFAAVAVLSMAIGVGANAAMFSVADTLVLRPLSVPRAESVVRVMAETTGAGFRSPTASALSYPDYVDVRDRARSFAGLAAYRLIVAGFTTRPDQQPQRRFGLAVSGNLFDVLGVQPALGRFFRAEEDRVAGRDPVVVLDHRTWQRDFGADPDVIGRPTRVGSVELTVIGVTRPEFTGPDHLVRPGFYVPLAMLPGLASGVPADELTRRDARNLEVKGRLQADASVAQAAEEVRLIAGALERVYPETNRGQGLTARTEVDGRIAQRPALGVLAAMLMTLAFAVLLVACANVAGLLASRAPVRARELAVRQAVGAGRVRLVRQLVVEALVLASAGGVAGLGLGYAVVAVFHRLELTTDVPLNLSFDLDARALTVGMVFAFGAGVLSSLLPAWRSARLDVVAGLAAPSASRGARSGGRHLLVCGQIALSLVLLTTAVFLYRAFGAEIDRGPGFRTTGVLMATFYPDLTGYDRPRTDAFYRLLAERVRALPGVQSVAVTSTVPMDANSVENTLIVPEGVELPADTPQVRVLATRVDEGYFDTLGIRIVSGRPFGPTDTDTAPRVAVVNQTLAARYWPGVSAIGKRFRSSDGQATAVEIVGIAADAKYRTLSEAPTEFVYYPRLQDGATNRGISFEGTLLVATATNAADVAAPLRDVVRAIDPDMPMFDVRTMASFYDTGVLNLTQVLVRTVGAMGSVGLLLAMIGLYGLVAYSVGRRTREIGIRVAVGAAPGAVLRMVLRHGLQLAVAGIGLGLVGSIAAAGVLRAAFPFPGVPGVDVVTYALVVPVLLAVTLLAAYAPARRAAHIDPLKALRTE